MAKKKAEKPVQETLKPAPEARSARAVTKFLRIAPRKLRLVVDTVRWAPAQRAFRILMTLRKKGARMVEKILKSAMANAKVLGMDEQRLYIADIRADGGPVLKRYMQRSMGRAEVNLKRMSHLSILLKESDRKVNGPEAASEKREAADGSETAVKKQKIKKKAAASRAGAKA